VPPKDILPTKVFATPKAWATWLARHHVTSKGLWIRFAKAGAKTRTLTHDEALEVALCFGWIDGQTASDAEDGFWCQRFTPRGPRSKWSQINCQKAEVLITSGRMQEAGLAAIAAAKEDGRWDAAYASQKTIEVPADLQDALDRNARAKAFFATLDSKNRYAVLYRIHDAKKPETRSRRIAKFVAMLAKHETLH
jgi:uncharacterized protein YdeI (YjbR/CyaY-like superfamily)